MLITGSTEITFNPNAPDVGSTTPGAIVPTRAILLSNGNTLLGWTERTPTGGAIGKVQIFDPAGNALGPAMIVRTEFGDPGIFLDAVATTDGGFFVQVSLGGETVQFNRYDAAGNFVGMTAQTSFGGGDAPYEMVALPGGGLAALVMDYVGTPNGDGTTSFDNRVVLRTFDATGGLTHQTILPLAVEGSGGGFHSDISLQPNGNIIVTWVEPIGSEFGQPTLHGQLFSSTGEAITSAFLVDDVFPHNDDGVLPPAHVDPVVETFADSSFIMVWNRTTETVFQIFNADGSPQGAIISLGAGFGADGIFAHEVITLPDMTFVIGGSAAPSREADASGRAIIVQQFGRDGAPIGGRVTVNLSETGDQRSLDLVATGNGGFSAVWIDEGEISGRDNGFFPVDTVLDVWRRRDFTTQSVANAAPVAQDGTGSGNEDASISGQAAATDANGDALSYSLVSGPARGTLTFNADGSYVYVPEANYHGSDSFTFRANDGRADSNVATVSLTIASANDAPTDIELSGATVAENAAAGTVVGTATATDADSGDTRSFSLVNDAGGRFAIDAATGVLTVAGGAALDFEAAESYQLVIRVTDAAGASYDETFTIAVTNVNEAPDSLSLASGGTVAENSANGTVVGQFAATDPDSGATLSYSLVDNAGGRFAIDTATGQLTVANGALLDFETAASHNVVVRVTDQGGLSRDLTATVTLTDVNEGTPINEIVGTDRSDIITGTAGADEINAGRGADIVFAGGGDDIIDGGLGNDWLVGGSGNDRIFGGLGRDTLVGGTGNDLLVGGGGQDILTGGSGQDVFRFDSIADSRPGLFSRDWITDFDASDIIDLSGIDADVNQAGDQAFTFIGNAAFSGAAGELRFGNNGRLQGDVNGDGVADFEIDINFSGAVPTPPLGAGDFIL